ncbi:MAG: tyrosine-type recombinase/integrase, partial [Saprospiraceae bacterium]
MIQEDLLTRFRDYLQYERRYSVHTLDGYTNDTHQFAAFLQSQYGPLKLTEVTHHHIRSWAVYLLKAKMQSVTVRRKMSSIAHLYKWLRRSGFISHNPVLKVQLPKIPVRLPKSLPANIIKQLWNLITPKDESKYDLIRNQALIGLLYGCGLRRSEIINVAWGDLDFQRQVLRIEGKGRKFRMVPVNDHLVIVLKKLKELASAAWGIRSDMRIILMDNGKPCYPKYVHNKVIELIGTVSTAEKKSPHVLRHSMATH